MIDNKKTIKLHELISWVKKEIRLADLAENDPAPLFAIDEVTLEVNFVLGGEGAGTFDMVVVKADTKVTEERVQKATIHLKSLIPAERLSEMLEKDHSQAYQRIVNESIRVLLKGPSTPGSLDVEVPEY